MKRLLLSFFGVFLFIFFIWTLKGYEMYGDRLQHYHLDLLSTLEQLNTDKYFAIDDLQWVNYLEDLSNKLDGVSNNVFIDGFFDFVIFLIKPIQLIAKFSMDIVNILIGIFKFLFNPIFVLR